MPILNCFVFDIKSKRLELTAADNEITLRTYIDLVESDADIRFAVNAKNYSRRDQRNTGTASGNLC